MLTPSECLLKAENYAVAARLADDEERMSLLELSVLWRQRSFELRMLRFEHLKELADETGPDPRGIAD
jgi:hypothetical protein